MAAALAATALPGAAQAAGLAFVTPTAYGVADLGQSVAYVVDDGGAGCGAVTVTAQVVADTTVHAGPSSSGCEGIVVVPGGDAIDQAERAGADISIRLVATGAGEATVELLPHRLQAEHLAVVAGAGEVAPSQDPRGGGASLAVQGVDTVVSLGTVDLSGISSMSFRWATPTARSTCVFNVVPFLSNFLCPSTPPGVQVHAGAPDGPLVLDWRVSTQATTANFHTYERTVAPITNAPATPVELFATFSGAPTADGLVNLNFVDLNGTGVAQPHAFSPDPDGTVWLFDGTLASLDAWRWADRAGTGRFRFVPEERAIVSDGADSYTLFWYAGRQFADFVMRTEFKVEQWPDNSGVFVRFTDPMDDPDIAVNTGHEVQIEERGMWGVNANQDTELKQTGGVYGLAAAERIATNAVGDWNTMEIRVVGQGYQVAVNGRLVTTFTSTRALEGYIGIQAENQFHVWFRDIRVYPCASASDAPCTGALGSQ